MVQGPLRETETILGTFNTNKLIQMFEGTTGKNAGGEDRPVAGRALPTSTNISRGGLAVEGQG